MAGATDPQTFAVGTAPPKGTTPAPASLAPLSRSIAGRRCPRPTASGKCHGENCHHDCSGNDAGTMTVCHRPRSDAVELRGLEPLTPTLPVRLGGGRERAATSRPVRPQRVAHSVNEHGCTRSMASCAQRCAQMAPCPWPSGRGRGALDRSHRHLLLGLGLADPRSDGGAYRSCAG